MNYVFRLTHGQDLRREIIEFCKQHNIEAGIVKCGVGCLCEARYRLADGESVIHEKNKYEIVSLMGTVSKEDCHIHISLGGEDGKVVGGHLKYGSLVGSTAEVCIEDLEKYIFTREFDERTGYDELVVSEKKSGSR